MVGGGRAPLLEEATGEENEGRVEQSWNRERERETKRIGEREKEGVATIGCKSLDKRPRIVKTRRDRDSILISCPVSGIDTQRR